MDDKKKTWRSTAWKVLTVLALIAIYGSMNSIANGKLPPPGPERHGWLFGTFCIPAALLGAAMVLFVSEKTR